jgi:GTPase SAR1 family protein
MNEINEFLSKNDNADGVIILSLETANDETKRQLGFYAKKFEHMLPINEYIQRSEHNLDLRERGIPINQARIKLFEQQNTQASRKQILPLIEQFAKDFVPQNSS